jgi:hypothetical protein
LACAEGNDFLLDYGSRKGNDLDGQRKFAEDGNKFCGVRNHYHFLRGGRDYLLAQQRAAAAFDQAQMRIEFIGAVDGDIDDGMLVERGQRNAGGARLIGGLAWKLGCLRLSCPRGRARLTLRPRSRRSNRCLIRRRRRR